MCAPDITDDIDHVIKGENTVEVIWKGSLLAEWLLKGNTHKDLKVKAYEVTINPAENNNNIKPISMMDKDEETG